jgi:hypothetical protein
MVAWYITSQHKHVDLLPIGAGALSSPLIATQFSQLRQWYFHYLVSLGMAISNTIILYAVFGFKTQDGQLHSAHGTSIPYDLSILRMPPAPGAGSNGKE